MRRKELGMKINRVTLYNFSSYVGENTIVLDTHGEQNIILIGGNNGAGKTSFFTAIKLALYGPQCFRFQDKNNRYTARIKELINHVAFLSDNVKSYVEVEIDLLTDRTHTLYTIRREWSFVENAFTKPIPATHGSLKVDRHVVIHYRPSISFLIPPSALHLGCITNCIFEGRLDGEMRCGLPFMAALRSFITDKAVP